MRRRLTLLACLLALAAVALVSSAAGRRPEPKPHRIVPVSAAAPYVAPWDTRFRRYSTQILAPVAFAPNVRRVTVSPGQWWRLIYYGAQFSTNATVANRTMAIRFSDAAGNIIMQENAPAVQPASSNYTYLFGPGLSTFANVTDPNAAQLTTGVPDLLWQEGTTIDLNVINKQAEFGWSTYVVAAVEVYVPEKDNPGVLVPAPIIP